MGTIYYDALESCIVPSNSLSKTLPHGKEVVWIWPEDRHQETFAIEPHMVSYAQVIRSLMYIMMCTRLDLGYTVSLINKYQSNPGLAH